MCSIAVHFGYSALSWQWEHTENTFSILILLGRDKGKGPGRKPSQTGISGPSPGLILGTRDATLQEGTSQVLQTD